VTPDPAPTDPPAAAIQRARPLGSALLFWSAAVAALLFACGAAWRRSWVCDDAFISFRYAENLVKGLGLVFNEGERVEGYTNFLWTLWTAFGLWLHVDPERWVKATGLACYLGSLTLLAWNSWNLRRESPGLVAWLPLAAILGALHADWQIYASGGLETSLFTLLVVLVYVLLAGHDTGRVRAGVAGLVLAMAAMTRPDGLILAVTATLYLFVADARRPRTALALAAVFFLVWAPYTAWRIAYFGDFFPNTYYAKSAAIAWYSQGAIYAGLYFARYWPLLLGPVLVALSWWRATGGEDLEMQATRDRWRRRVLLAAMLAAAYMAFVLRVGGDFMFARFLIPVTPLFVILFELGVTRMDAERPRRQWVPAAIAAVAAAGIVLTPYPLPRDPFAGVKGIVFEPNFYSHEANRVVRNQGLVLRRYFAGLPVRVAFFGGEARLVFYAQPRVAIECATGLTDRHIARQPLAERGRVGHEKLATADYVLGVRDAHFAFFRGATNALGLNREIPLVDIEMGGVRGRVLTWDSAVLDSVRHRGATIQDFPAELDALLAEPSPEHGMLEWFREEKLERFYFRDSPDPERQALLRRRIREAGRGG
jgi:hypothetical protein